MMRIVGRPCTAPIVGSARRLMRFHQHQPCPPPIRSIASDQIGSGQRYLIDIQNLAIFVVNSLGDGTYLKSSTISPLIAEPMRLTVSPKDLPAPFAL